MPRADWTKRAARELDDLYDYIGVSRKSRQAAQRLIVSIRDKAEAYARQPGIGTLHDEFEPPAGFAGAVRSFRVKSDLGFYVEQPDGIIVLRVIDGRRDYGQLFG